MMWNEVECCVYLGRAARLTSYQRHFSHLLS